jgi:hypothetical protein
MTTTQRMITTKFAMKQNSRRRVDHSSLRKLEVYLISILVHLKVITMGQLIRSLLGWIPVGIGGYFAAIFLLGSQWVQGAMALLITLGWAGLAYSRMTTRSLALGMRIILAILCAAVFALLGAGVGWLFVFVAKWTVLVVVSAILWLCSVMTEALSVFHISIEISIPMDSIDTCFHTSVEPVCDGYDFGETCTDQPVCKQRVSDYISAGAIILISGCAALYGFFAAFLSNFPPAKSWS